MKENNNLEKMKIIMSESLISESDSVQRDEYIYWEFLGDCSVLKLITGPVGSGRSVFATQIISGEKYAYIDFVNEYFDFSDDDILENFINIINKRFPGIEHIIFRNIQNNNRWWHLVYSLMSESIKVFMIESYSSSVLERFNSEIKDSFVHIPLMPMSFRDFLKLKEKFSKDINNHNKNKIIHSTGNEKLLNGNKLLDEYLKLGGFPEPITSSKGKTQLKESHLKIFDLIIKKEILSKENIRNPQKLLSMAKELLNCTGQKIIYSELKEKHGIGDIKTVKKYLFCLTESKMLYLLKNYSSSLKSEHYIVYSTDTGLSLSISRDGALAKSSIDRENIMKTAVFIELMRKKAVDCDLDIYYMKINKNTDIDFLLTVKNRPAKIICVKNIASPDKLKKRELDSFVMAAEKSGLQEITVLTNKAFFEKEISGKKILFIPLEKWLMKIK